MTATIARPSAPANGINLFGLISRKYVSSDLSYMTEECDNYSNVNRAPGAWPSSAHPRFADLEPALGLRRLTDPPPPTVPLASASERSARTAVRWPAEPNGPGR